MGLLTEHFDKEREEYNIRINYLESELKRVQSIINIISPDKFRILADWIDIKTKNNKNKEVQIDLRDIADEFEQATAIIDSIFKDK